METPRGRMNKTAAYLCLKGFAAVIYGTVHLWPIGPAIWGGIVAVTLVLDQKRKTHIKNFLQEAGAIARDVFSHLKEDIGRIGRSIGRGMRRHAPVILTTAAVMIPKSGSFPDREIGKIFEKVVSIQQPDKNKPAPSTYIIEALKP